MEEDDPFEQKEEVVSSVEQTTKELEQLFGKQNVVRIDGSFDRIGQQTAMENFKNGSAKVMVATTVIEVGVDIPEASTMVIQNAERFGLSSLHQLRGRIGRNGKESHCFILAGNGISDSAKQRLEFFKNHTSGFDIAEYDFETRGAGDIFGTEQSGEQMLKFSPQTLSLARKILSEMDIQKMVFISNN